MTRASDSYGFVQLFTGDGKGKTTAAFGTVMRSVGAGKKVAVIFFDKGGENYCERKVLDQLGVLWKAFGRDRRDPSGRFDFSIINKDKEFGAQALEQAKEFFSRCFDLVVLDEINSSAALGIVNPQIVLDLIKTKPSQTEIIMTGRNAPREFLDVADLVTEMKMHKHYYYKGVKARAGLDY